MHVLPARKYPWLWAKTVYGVKFLDLFNTLTPDLVSYVRQVMLEKFGGNNKSCKNNGSKRLYISRSDAHGRRITNENTIVEYLLSIGFESVYPGKLSMEEQVSLFSQAECVVGPHGAAMSNLTFCQKGCSVIELFPDSYKIDLYKTIAGAVGAVYMSLGGENMSSMDDYWTYQHNDFSVDLSWYLSPSCLVSTREARVGHAQRLRPIGMPTLPASRPDLGPRSYVGGCLRFWGVADTPQKPARYAGLGRANWKLLNTRQLAEFLICIRVDGTGVYRIACPMPARFGCSKGNSRSRRHWAFVRALRCDASAIRLRRHVRSDCRCRLVKRQRIAGAQKLATPEPHERQMYLPCDDQISLGLDPPKISVVFQERSRKIDNVSVAADLHCHSHYAAHGIAGRFNRIICQVA